MDLFKETRHNIKYVDDLILECTYFFSEVMIQVFNGLIKNIGLSDKDIALINEKDPSLLEKAINFTSVLGSLKGLLAFGRKPKSFKIKGLKVYKQNGKHLTDDEWNKLNEQIAEYWNSSTAQITEEISIKNFLLGMVTAEAEIQKQHIKQYGKKSLLQVIKERFKGHMPGSLKEAKSRFKMNKSVQSAYVYAYNKAAEYVQTKHDDIKKAIRHQVNKAHLTNKTPIELASDLYWMKEKKPELTAKHTVQGLMRDWHRVAVTELATLHATGKMAAHEDDARISIKNPKQAVYMVFSRGTCSWCQSHNGTIVRLIPRELIKNENDDSLTSLGIKDPHTNIAVWVGKNNVGFKEANWRVCTPAHPHNIAELQRIDLEEQVFNKKTQSVDYKDKGKLGKYIPQEYLQPIPKVKNEVKDDIATWNGNKYKVVNENEYDKELTLWRNNKNLPIPVTRSQKNYNIIFQR